MGDLKIIEASTNLKTDDPDVFFNWFENKFIVGFDFGFGDRFFLMSTGRMIPLRKDNILTISIQHHLASRLQDNINVFPENPITSKLIITAIQSPHGGTDVKAICKTQSPEFETLFRDIWDEISLKHPININALIANQVDSKETWLPWLHIPDEKKNRQIIELWCKGKNAKEIAKEIFMGAPTIHNIISRLRKSYPKARIPKDRERKSMRF